MQDAGADGRLVRGKHVIDVAESSVQAHLFQQLEVLVEEPLRAGDGPDSLCFAPCI